MKVFHTDTHKKPAGKRITKWVAQGLVLGLVLPVSAFAVAPLNSSTPPAVPSTTLDSTINFGTPNCALKSGGDSAGLVSGALANTGIWLNTPETPLGVWSCTTNGTIDSTDTRASMSANSTYVVYKTTAAGKVGFLKLTTGGTASVYNSCAEVDAPVADVCNPTAPANVPVFGPIGLLASLTGLLWFGRRRRKD